MGDSTTTRWWPIYLFVGLCAVAIRVPLILSGLKDSPTSLVFDEAFYWEMAGHIIHDHTLFRYVEGVPFVADRTPGYPAFVAVIRWLFGGSLRAVYWVQALLMALSAVLSVLLVQRRLSKNKAIFVGIVVAVYPWLILKSYSLLTWSLYIPLVLSIFVILERLDERYIRQGTLLGVIGGAAVMVRPEFLLFLPACLLWLWVSRWKRKEHSRQQKSLIKTVAVGCVIVCVFAGAWMTRNMALLGSPVLQSNSGQHLYTANHPHAKGDTLSHLMHQERHAEFFATARNAPREELQRNEYFLSQTIEEISAHPGDYIARSLRRVGYLWNIEVREAIFSYSRLKSAGHAKQLATMKGLAFFLGGVSLIFLLFCALKLPFVVGRNWKFECVFVAYTTLLSAVMMGQAQYHLPLIPLLLGMTLSAQWKRQPWRWLLAVVLVAGLLVNVILNNEWSILL